MPRFRVSVNRHSIDTFPLTVEASTVKEAQRIVEEVLEKYRHNPDALAKHYHKRWLREQDSLGHIMLEEV